MPRLSRSVGGLVVIGVLLAPLGCGSGPVHPTVVVPSYNQLRNFTLAYAQATASLQHPPKNAAELRPFLEKFGSADELLRSPTDRELLVVHWNTDIGKLQSQNNLEPIWVYEKNSHSGKRWVLQGRNPVELTESEFRAAPFAPGFQ